MQLKYLGILKNKNKINENNIQENYNNQLPRMQLKCLVEIKNKN